VLPTKKKKRKKRVRKDPGKQVSLYFGGRNEATIQGGEVSLISRGE
jgi:hypothetical protein